MFAFLPELVLVSKICVVPLVPVKVQVMGVVVSLSNFGQPDEGNSDPGKSQLACLTIKFEAEFQGGVILLHDIHTLGVLDPGDCSLGQSRTKGYCRHTPGFDG